MVNVSNNNFTSPFNFSYPVCLPSLEVSILEFGQMNPILTTITEVGDCIIDGFRRYNILRQFGKDALFHKIQPINLEKALNIYLHLNMDSRSLNIIEKIRLCRFVTSNKISISEQILRKAGLGDIRTNSTLYDFVERQSDSVKNIIVEKQLTTSLLERLSKIGDVYSEKILIYIKNHSLTHQQVRELITDIYQLFMGEKEISSVISKLPLTPYKELKKEIRSLKNPTLIRMEKEFENFTAQFSKISVCPPENFEGNSYRIEAKFNNEDEIDHILKEVLRLKEEWKRNPILK